MRKTICMCMTLLILFSVELSYAQRTAREVTWVNSDIRNMEGLSHRILKSEALGCDVGYVVWTPVGYTGEANKRYPVIYFLHGLGGNEASDSASFSDIVSKAIEAGQLPPVICVFPNGGVSWYTGEVEKMIVNELVPAIDNGYRTLAKAQSRAVAGFSMGGYGSVYLSVMHPELFCATGSFGGRLRSSEQLFPAVERAVSVWKTHNHGFFFVNGDNDRPEEFNDLVILLNKYAIESKTMVLPDTGHDLGKYYRESSGELFKLIKQRIQTE